MALRCNMFRILPKVRCFSSAAKHLDVSVNEDNGVATVTMKRPPVNSLNYELLTEFSNVLTDLDKNKSRGMILTSVCYLNCQNCNSFMNNVFLVF